MKADQTKKRIERVRLRAKKLISRPDFQEDVKFLRKKWQIPEDGLRSNEASEQWHRWLDQISDKFMDKEWSPLRKEILNLRKKSTMPFQHDRVIKKKGREFNRRIPINDFRNDIQELVIKYKQPTSMKNSIKHYLLFKNIEFLMLRAGPTMQPIYDSERRLQKVAITVEANTTLNDVKAIWPMVQHMQRKMPSRQQEKIQPSKNFDRDQKAYELQLAGKTYRQIATALKKEFGGSLMYNDIGKIIERHKKRLGIN